jgi:hypothetical protein
MADPDNAPDTLAREELGLDPGELGSPVKAAASSCSAFAVGAAVPLVPYLLATRPCHCSPRSCWPSSPWSRSSR